MVSSKFSGFPEFYKEHSALVADNCTQHLADERRNLDVNVQIAVETLVTLTINDALIFELFTSPKQLEALSVGHLICEGIINSLDDVSHVECTNNGFINISTTNRIPREIKEKRRKKQYLHHLDRGNKPEKQPKKILKIAPSTIFQSQRAIIAMSEVWPISGGTHSSGLCNIKGEVRFFSEDIGRHNTLDKIVGTAMIAGEDLTKLFAVTSGRLSAAIVMKIARANIPVLVSNNAPLNLALKIARKEGMTIVGFSRFPKLKIYSHPERIRLQD